jgi:hypothetical protein
MEAVPKEIGGLSGILCAGVVAPSLLNEPIVEQDSELSLCLEPLAQRHFPLSAAWRKTRNRSFVAASSVGK